MFEFEPVHANLKASAEQGKIILCAGRDVIVRETGEFPSLPECGELFERSSLLCIGNLENAPCFFAELAASGELPQSLRRIPARSLLADASPDCWNALARGRELFSWKKLHRFCGVCKAPLQASEHDIGLVCPECGARFYPQIAPAVITAVTRNNGKEILLAHNFNFQPGIHGLIAGFIEAGENAEDAVRREVFEETSVRVGKIRYLSSQSWPFPNSLMLAFQAEYLSGEAEADGTELESLGWFTRDDLPALPPHGSIARAVISGLFWENSL